MSGTINGPNPGNSEVGVVNQSDGALHVANSATGVPRTPAQPTISAVGTSQLELDAGASNEIIGVKVMLNAFSDVAADGFLVAGGEGVAFIPVGGTAVLVADAAIIRVDTVGVGDVSGADQISTSETLDSAASTAKKTWVFASSANVKSVRVSLTPTHTTDRYTLLIVDGYAHD